MPPVSPGIKKKCLLPPKRLLNITKSLKKLYENGLFKEKLTSLLQVVDIEDINSFLEMTINLTEKKLSTLGSLPQNKKKILIDKLLLLKKNFLNSKSLKILVADSTSKEKDSSPWWNQSSMAMSLNLPLPTMTDLQESDLTSFSSFVNVHKQNLDYCQIKKIVHQKMNLQPNLFLSSLTLPQNSMVSENITYGRKIRFFPNQEQKIEFKKYFGATRFFYNKTIYSYNQNKFYLSLESARPIIMKKDSELLENELWMKEIPYDTRQLAVKSAVNALKTCFSQYRSGLIKKFKMSYKKAKDKKQIFFVDHRAIKNLCLFPSRLKENAELKVKKINIEITITIFLKVML